MMAVIVKMGSMVVGALVGGRRGKVGMVSATDRRAVAVVAVGNVVAAVVIKWVAIMVVVVVNMMGWLWGDMKADLMGLAYTILQLRWYRWRGKFKGSWGVGEEGKPKVVVVVIKRRRGGRKG